MKNELIVSFPAKICNVQTSRAILIGFLAELDLPMTIINELKTALSEAVTNAIIHGYEQSKGKVFIRCTLRGDLLEVEIEDKGKGIVDVELAMEPMYTTKPEADRSGMGFSFMEAFMDELEVSSMVGIGTTVSMKKKLGTISWLDL